jgi:hypothetical protein
MNTVILTGGVSVLAVALRLAWDLEARTVRLALDDAGRLLASPASLLTPADIAAIRQNRAELRRIVRYCADVTVVM